MRLAFDFNIMGIMSGTALVVKYVFYILILAGAGWLFFWVTSFKNIIVIRQLTGSKTKRVVRDKWKIWKDPATKVEYVRLMKCKDWLPIPPDSAVDLTSKGKLFVEAYRNSNGEYSYIEDKGKPDFFQPLTTNQRIILANQHSKANSKGSNSLMQNLPMIVGLSFIIILFFGFITHTTELSAPFIEKAKVDAAIVKSVENIVNTQHQINNNMQKIGSALDITLNVSDPPN